jgi:hypothetical protein
LVLPQITPLKQQQQQNKQKEKPWQKSIISEEEEEKENDEKKEKTNLKANYNWKMINFIKCESDDDTTLQPQNKKHTGFLRETTTTTNNQKYTLKYKIKMETTTTNLFPFLYLEKKEISPHSISSRFHKILNFFLLFRIM